MTARQAVAPSVDSDRPGYRHPGQRGSRSGPNAKQSQPSGTTATPASTMSYLVATPCVIVKGRRGSHGTFYEGEQITPWPSADAVEDAPDDDELRRLMKLGFLREVRAG